LSAGLEGLRYSGCVPLPGNSLLTNTVKGEYLRCARKFSPAFALRASARQALNLELLEPLELLELLELLDPVTPMLTSPDLTRRESQIMEILYRRRRASVEDIRAELPEAPSPSSVRKLLDIMMERGLLGREYDGPRFVYFPSAKAEDASRSALRQLVRTFFDNSPGSAMAALMDLSDAPLTEDEHRRLKALVERGRPDGGKR
jgi:BlaI family transcriptional regulator, penicillinase repressor